jgi:hypothetical protein
MISHDKKFLVVHINKTGGTSIYEALMKYAAAPEFRSNRYFQNHLTLQQLISKQRSPDYLRFTFVRNPWDRLVSMYHSRLVKKKHLQSGLKVYPQRGLIDTNCLKHGG